jgi:hypothetical protein
VFFGLLGRKSAAVEKPAKLSPREALDAKPVKATGATLEPDGQGGGKLTIPLRAELLGFWGRMFGVPEGATKTYELDPVGRFVWEHVDGRTSVRQLARKLAKAYHLDERVAEVSTARFLHTLTRRGLIGVPIKRKGK